METMRVCPDCKAAWRDEQTCQDYFHQMLSWEWEYPGYGEVHHLMVLCYHLQHPSLYSPEGLRYGIRLLATFEEEGVSPAEVRKRQSAHVNSSTRNWKIKGTPASHGIYDPPIQWTFTAANVIASGAENYCESVRTWARSMYDTLKTAGMISSLSRRSQK